jgi:hypothetical protein
MGRYVGHRVKRPALQSSKELLVFCSTDCRSAYRKVLEPSWKGWTDTETTHDRPRNVFGNPTSRPACSTCGRSFDGTEDEPVSALGPVVA